MAKKKPKIDGLNAPDKKYLRSAIRRIWRWSEPRKLALKRADGRCELCQKKVGDKLTVDHVSPVGPIEAPFAIQRMWVESSRLQCLCKACHSQKTKEERVKK